MLYIKHKKIKKFLNIINNDCNKVLNLIISTYIKQVNAIKDITCKNKP